MRSYCLENSYLLQDSFYISFIFYKCFLKSLDPNWLLVRHSCHTVQPADSMLHMIVLCIKFYNQLLCMSYLFSGYCSMIADFIWCGWSRCWSLTLIVSFVFFLTFFIDIQLWFFTFLWFFFCFKYTAMVLGHILMFSPDLNGQL